MEEPRVIEYAKVYKDKMVIWKSFELYNIKKKENTEKKPRKETQHFTGVMSQGTKTKIKKIVEVWDKSIEAKLTQKRMAFTYKWKYMTFVTLTIPSEQIHSDREIKRECLNWFLIDAVRQWGIRNYLWVAEVATNGRIHFHILFDRYVDHTHLRLTWNKAVNKLGYVDRYKEKTGKGSPPSTDIHSIRGVKDIAKYIAKYMSKDDNVRLIEGRLWSCSRLLSKLDVYSTVFSQEFSRLIWHGLNDGSLRLQEGDYFSIVYGDIEARLKKYCPLNREWFRVYYLEIFEMLYRSGNLRKEEIEKEKEIEIKKVIEIVPARLSRVIQTSMRFPRFSNPHWRADKKTNS